MTHLKNMQSVVPVQTEEKTVNMQLIMEPLFKIVWS